MIAFLINYCKKILGLCEYEDCYREADIEVKIEKENKVLFKHKYCTDHYLKIEDAYKYANERRRGNE